MVWLRSGILAALFANVALGLFSAILFSTTYIFGLEGSWIEHVWIYALILFETFAGPVLFLMMYDRWAGAECRACGKPARRDISASTRRAGVSFGDGPRPLAAGNVQRPPAVRGRDLHVPALLLLGAAPGAGAAVPRHHGSRPARGAVWPWHVLHRRAGAFHCSAGGRK